MYLNEAGVPAREDEEYSEAMRRLMTRAVVSLEDVAVVLDISLNSTRKAAAAGEIETFGIGSLKKAVTEPLRRRLRLNGSPDARLHKTERKTAA